MPFRRLRREKAFSPSPVRARRKKVSNRRPLRLEQLEARELLAVDATLALGPATIAGTTARFEVALEFNASAGEMLSYFSLDVEPSCVELVLPGSDYSAFSFIEAAP